jgi:phage shock protein PspC (stress-responsive transcriptional regulator)
MVLTVVISCIITIVSGMISIYIILWLLKNGKL